MVHIFDHSQKAYVSGEGRKAIWQEQDMEQKVITPRVFLFARLMPKRKRMFG